MLKIIESVKKVLENPNNNLLEDVNKILDSKKNDSSVEQFITVKLYLGTLLCTLNPNGKNISFEIEELTDFINSHSSYLDPITKNIILQAMNYKKENDGESAT